MVLESLKNQYLSNILPFSILRYWISSSLRVFSLNLKKVVWFIHSSLRNKKWHFLRRLFKRWWNLKRWSYKRIGFLKPLYIQFAFSDGNTLPENQTKTWASLIHSRDSWTRKQINHLWKQITTKLMLNAPNACYRKMSVRIPAGGRGERKINIEQVEWLIPQFSTPSVSRQGRLVPGRPDVWSGWEMHRGDTGD